MDRYAILRCPGAVCYCCRKRSRFLYVVVHRSRSQLRLWTATPFLRSQCSLLWLPEALVFTCMCIRSLAVLAAGSVYPASCCSCGRKCLSGVLLFLRPEVFIRRLAVLAAGSVYPVSCCSCGRKCLSGVLLFLRPEVFIRCLAVLAAGSVSLSGVLLFLRPEVFIRCLAVLAAGSVYPVSCGRKCLSGVLLFLRPEALVVFLSLLLACVSGVLLSLRPEALVYPVSCCSCGRKCLCKSMYSSS